MLEHETEASPATEPDVTAESSPGPEVSSEAPSADVKEVPTSLLDVVKNAVEPKGEEDPEASSAPEAEKSEPEKTEGEAAKAEEPENFDGLPFGRHPRFQEVLKERNTFKTRVSDLETRTEALQGPADQYARIEQFMQANDISTEEMVNLFRLQALAKTDAKAALEELQPLLTDLYQRTGKFLPTDLREEIEAGTITEARGRELAEARAAKVESDRLAARATERANEVETSTADDRRNEAFAAALVDWEAATKGKDPDFAAKEDLIGDRCRTLIATQGQPKTPDAMKALLTQAHKEVTERLRTVIPARPGVKRTPESPSSVNVTAQPKTHLEAIQIALRQGS